MSQSNPHSLARILAAPWQQRRNAGGLWGFAVVIALCFAAPVVLLAWRAFADSPQQAALLRFSAVRAAWIGVAALMVAGWAMLVGNVQQQNHPTIARLVPHQPGQLRLALLVAWALASLAAAALPGFAFDAPLAWGVGIAGLLALLAACLRWPLLWLLGIVAPFVVGWLTRRYGAGEFIEALGSVLAAHEWLATAVVVTAGATVLVTMVRDGGARHAAAYEARKRLRQQVFQEQQGGGPVPVCTTKHGWIAGLAVDGRPYGWWMKRRLARRDSPLMARLLLGLGPTAHWTSRLFQAFWFVVVSTGLCVMVSLFLGGDMIAYVLPWIAFSTLTGLCTPALQAVPMLRQTQREQALLVLLPGVPRGARLNRWLAWQMSASFLLAAACALLAAWALDAAAEAIRPGVVGTSTGGMSLGMAAVLLPQVAWQWRRWARLGGTAGSAAQLPTIVPILMGIAVMGLHVLTGVGYVPVGVVLAVAALAYCAWRWTRMGAEPSALPVARLS